MFADISFPISSYQTFSYSIPEHLIAKISIGVRVNAPFGNRKVSGVVVNLFDQPKYKGTIRSIDSVLDNSPILSEELWKLICWLSDYYNVPIGVAAKAVLPSSLSTKYQPPKELFVKVLNINAEFPIRAKSQISVYNFIKSNKDFISIKELKHITNNANSIIKILHQKKFVEVVEKLIVPDLFNLSFKTKPKEIKLTGHQKKALEAISESVDKNIFSSTLLRGVTGSGKTEIYIEAALHAISKNKSVIVLLPEISLTPQIAGRFRSVFGDQVALWHSKLSRSARAWTWKKICDGSHKIVIGARSAIFSPLKRIGLIIVDEEQETSFKQASPDPRYHARDVALMRGKINKASVILASATPSLESYYNYINKKFNYIDLPERFGGAKYPDVHLVDMIKESEKTGEYGNIFSNLLLEKIGDRLNKNEQVMLLHNRRGYAPILMCGDCGNVSNCPHCNISLTYHRVGIYMQCHFCNYTQKSPPKKCDKCLSHNIKLSGIGTQKVEDELQNKFPKAVIARLDVDTAKIGSNMIKTLERFADGEINILVGTQMIAKGLDFENVTLVGVINGDTGLYLPDFRAGERIFQLIYQAAGRAGRGKIPGEVIVQSYNSDNSVIQSAVKLDLKNYYNICLKEREALNYPPFSWMVKFEIRGKNKNNVEKFANLLSGKIRNLPDGIDKAGPAYCYREQLKDSFRMQIVLRSNKVKDPNGSKLNKIYKSKFVNNSNFKIPNDIRLIIDINPMSLL